MARTRPDDYALICLEIGGREYLTEADAELAASNYQIARRCSPQARILIAISGYDQDPREIWEIPETRAYLKRWAELAGLTDWRKVIRLPWQDDLVPAILQLCGVFAADSPIEVDIPRREGFH